MLETLPAPRTRDTLPRALMSVVDDGLSLRQILLGHAWLHPDLGGDAGKEQPVVVVLWENASHHLPIRSGGDRAGNMRTVHLTEYRPETGETAAILSSSHKGRCSIPHRRPEHRVEYALALRQASTQRSATAATSRMI